MRPLLNTSLLPKVLISLCTCVEVVPVKVWEHVGRSSRVSEVPKMGELWTKDSEVLRRDSENAKLFRKCEFSFRGVLGGSDGRWVVGWSFSKTYG
jgi:hypothetical protein